MTNRVGLHNVLVEILGSDRVYFQPPESVKLQYPCILYSLDYAESIHASNQPYATNWRYQVLYIDKSPESEVPKKLLRLPTATFDRFYIADNLNHTSLKLYF